MRHSILIFFLATLCGLMQAKAQIDYIQQELDTLSKTVPGLNEKVDFTLVEAPLYELLRAVAETHNLNVSLNSLPAISVTNNFTDVTVKDLILFLCREYDLKIRFTNNIFAFYKESIPEVKEPIVRWDETNQKVGFNLRNGDLSELAREFTEKTPYNLVVSRNAESQRINAFMRDLPVKTALQNLADANDLELITKSDRVFQLNGKVVENTDPRNQRRGTYSSYSNRGGNFDLKTFQLAGEKYITLIGTNVSIDELLVTVCERLEIDYLFLSEIKGTMDCRLDSVLFEDFLEIALETSNLSYSVTEGGVYLIGTSQTAGLNGARVFVFRNRAVEGVQDVIPQALLKEVQIKPFNDMNALILSGSDKSILKLVHFLDQVDKSVPNVLIEVIVAEVRKGASVRTGVKAFIGDSVPATGGQVFGGVDVTLSSNSINNILNNLDSRGIMNLGRVTPQFYATLQAMEENNNLDIKSTPKLSTLNGNEATLKIGQSVYYLVETQNVTGGVNPIVTVTPRYENVEANLDLKITPFVSQYEDVTLTIEAEFSDFIEPTIEGAPPGNATRMFISKMRVKNEETVVLGGLEEVSKTESGSGVPILGRIPGLKWLFSSRSKSNSESKLMIFIKPTIVY